MIAKSISNYQEKFVIFIRTIMSYNSKICTKSLDAESILKNFKKTSFRLKKEHKKSFHQFLRNKDYQLKGFMVQAQKISTKKFRQINSA